MNLADYLRHETLDLAFFSGVNPIRNGAANLKPVLAAVDSCSNGLKPEEATVGKKTVPYTQDAVLRLLKSRETQPKTILNLSRSHFPSAQYTLSFVQPGWEVEFWLRIFMWFDYFTEGSEAEQRCGKVVDLVKSLHAATPCVYAYCHPKGDLGLGSDPHEDDPSAEKKVYEVYWLNVYGPKMVERLGRQRVLETPCHRLEELPGGAVLFLTRPTPVDFLSEEARVAQAKVLAHLRDDLSFEDALAMLRERSAILTPVARDWDQDIADLLELTLDDVSFSYHQQETARLNRYRPPEVREWRAAADVLPTDVEDPAAAESLYSDHYAERLVALLDQEIPEAVQQDPQLLPSIDYHFWKADYPGSFSRDDIDKDLVPAVGAYVGEMMVRRLGGRWVPRRNMDEAQVVVGDRVWLPFLRARHYLQDKQSALDYSLTKFYRVAASWGSGLYS